MAGHLCLKWNNHTSAFLKSISCIQVKEKYCDATIVCQGKYFPVHRVILSTCSDYFDEIFERIQCPHPYIVFKDIEPQEMEMLLNYMYQGEVNVVQEMLPSLIKAAEALRIKGLAVPDDVPSGKDSTSSSRKRSSSSSHDYPQSKKRSEDSSRRRRGDATLPASETSDIRETSDKNSTPSRNIANSSSSEINDIEPRFIKEELPDSTDYPDALLPEVPADGKTETIFTEFPITDGSSTFIKTEEGSQNENTYEEQCSSWGNFSGDSNPISNISVDEMAGQDDTSFSVNPVEGNRPTFRFAEEINLPTFSPCALRYLRGDPLEEAYVKEARNAVINELIQYLDSSNLLLSSDKFFQKSGYMKLQEKLLDAYPSCIREKGNRKHNRKRPLGDLFAKLADRRRKRYSRAYLALSFPQLSNQEDSTAFL